MEVKRNEINIPQKYLKDLREEFPVSRVTISNALRDITHSKLAKKIRIRAKEILEREIKSIEI